PVHRRVARPPPPRGERADQAGERHPDRGDDGGSEAGAGATSGHAQGLAVRPGGSHDAPLGTRLLGVKIEKLPGNSFVVLDLVDAPCSVGIVRAAPKVLQGGAKALARTATYTYAAR